MAKTYTESLAPVLAPFFVSRGTILVAAIFFQWLLDNGHAFRYAYINHAPLATLSGTFDANWYGDIAANGYSTSADVSTEQNYHFFPLFPLLLRLTGTVTGLNQVDGGYNVAGVLINHIFFLIALVLLYKLTLAVFGETSMARRSVWLMAVLPWSFVFSMAYTESLFLMLSLGALLLSYLNRDKADIGLAIIVGLLAGLTTLTRSQGLLVALPVGWLLAITPEGLRWIRRAALAFFAIAPALLAVIGFPLYIGLRTGDLMAVLEVNHNWASQGLLHDLLRIFVLPPANPVWFVDFFATIGLIVWTTITIVLVARFLLGRRSSSASPRELTTQNLGDGAFVLYASAYFLFTLIMLGNNSSWGRYMLMAFPCIWVIASALKNPAQVYRFRVLSLGLQVLFFGAALFMQVTP